MKLPLMITPVLLLTAATPFDRTVAQDGAPKVRIEVTRTVNGKTTHETRTLDATDDEGIEEALRELGVMNDLEMEGGGGTIAIDIDRDDSEDSALNDMSMAIAIAPEDLADLEELMYGGAYLGVNYGNFNKNGCKDGNAKLPVDNAACITHVEKGSAADKAGLQAGDVVTRIADEDIESGSDLAEVIRDHEPGDKVKITFYRAGKKLNTTAELGEREGDLARAYNYRIWSGADGDEGFVWNSSPKAFLGVEPGDEDETGAGVGDVVEGSAAEKMGVKEGDRILAVNGDPVDDFDALADRIRDMEPGDAVELDLKRDGKDITLKGELGQRDGPTWVMPPNAPLAPVPPVAPMPNYPGMSRDDREEMRREMDDLRREMSRLRREIRGEWNGSSPGAGSVDQPSQEEMDRLKAGGVTDLDRQITLPDLQCYPNPGNGSFHLEFQVPERGDLAVDVRDTAGRSAYHETITGFKGRYERTLDLSDLENGTYFLVIAQNGQATARKLVKQ
ncbi:MAG: PDZ domain-containing protein [Flavobacteriales bacterium]|nr:PDZ domain-containing protein [Flavobacteriales bacterium]MCB9166413.1 PDZ domain-containing protein [Flavobacteriales bacterium]